MKFRNENDEIKLKSDTISDTYVYTNQNESKGKKYNFSPKVFAQRFFFKLGEIAEEDEKVEESLVEDAISPQNRGFVAQEDGCKLIFKEGACDEDDEILSVEKLQDLEEQSSNVRPPFVPNPSHRPPRPPQKQTPDMIARDIYNKMLVLNLLYRDLRNFNTKFDEDFDDMIAELNIITFAMLRIYQTLSRDNRIPIQNQRKPFLRSFCEGVVVTSNYLRGIMFDVRRLQREVEVQNIDRQLIIINLTLQSQHSQLQEMRQDCIEGGVL